MMNWGKSAIPLSQDDAGNLALAIMLPEIVARRHMALIGACVVANRKAAIAGEQARVVGATEGGLSQADRAKRLDELRAAILKAAARGGLALHEVEGAEFHRVRFIPICSSTSVPM